MDDCHLIRFIVLVLISSCTLGFRDESSGTIVFLDSFKHQYFRGHQSEASHKYDSVSLNEVAAIMNVLIGLAPPPSISVQSSSKLNKLLVPNPFDRPHAVFMLEVQGTEDLHDLLNSPNWPVDNFFSNKFFLDPTWSEIHLPDENEISLFVEDEHAGLDCDALCIDKELSHLAALLDGSYVGSSSHFDGNLTVSLASGMPLNLQFSKKSDSNYMLSLVSLILKIKRVLQFHSNPSESIHRKEQLVSVHFKGIQALQEEYGCYNVALQGMELFLHILKELFGSLHEVYHGKVAGIVLFKKKAFTYLGRAQVAHSPAHVSRSLEEEAPLNDNISAAKLVKSTLAWTTGIIFLVSVLVGVLLLLNMPLTKDTLLYSNGKLD